MLPFLQGRPIKLYIFFCICMALEIEKSTGLMSAMFGNWALTLVKFSALAFRKATICLYR